MTNIARGFLCAMSNAFKADTNHFSVEEDLVKAFPPTMASEVRGALDELVSAGHLTRWPQGTVTITAQGIQYVEQAK